MFMVTGTLDQIERVLSLAQAMISYNHHAKYPDYVGHSEPEETCQHPDCAATREVEVVLS